MTRGIHQGNIQIRGGKQRLLGKNGDSPLPFQGVGIQKRVPVVYPTQSAAGTAAIEQRFGKGSLTRVHMSQQTNTTRNFFRLSGHSASPLPWKCKCIITWKGAESREKRSIFSRVYLKTVNMPKQRVISHSAAPFSLEIQQVFLRKKPCTLEKSLPVSHISSFRIDPKECGLLFSYHCSATGKSEP